MKRLRILILAMITMIMISFTFTIEAHDWDHVNRYRYGTHPYRHHYHRDNDGNFLGGLIVGGIIAGTINRSDHRYRQSDADDWRYYPNHRVPLYGQPYQIWHRIIIRTYDPYCGCDIIRYGYQDDRGAITYYP